MTKGASMTDLQGQAANEAGRSLEERIEKEALKYGVPTIQYRDMLTDEGKQVINDSKLGVLIKNVPYTNMFGSEGRGDFLLCLFNIGAIRIECRGQSVRGSVQDKLPKLLGDCMCMEEKRVIMVVEGKGVTPNALNWLRSSVSAIKHKNMSVKTLEEFNSWLSGTLKALSNVKQSSKRFILKNLYKRPVSKKKPTVLKHS